MRQAADAAAVSATSNVVDVSLKADGLACVRGERLLFSGLTFAAGPGEAIEVRGPNGSGKTSLLKMAAGFLAPAAGSLIVSAPGSRESGAPLVHLLSHLDGLKSAMSPREMVVFYSGLFGGAAKQDDVLSAVGLTKQRDLPVQFLSAGQKRRLSLSRLLVARRPVWLLDEPFASLDSAGRVLIVSLIETHLAGGGIVLAATHDPILATARQINLGIAA